MSGPTDDVRRWSPLRWLMTLMVIFGGQAAIFLWLGSRAKPPAAPPLPRAPSVQVSAAPAGEPAVLDDPTLLVRPTPRGFSSVWLNTNEIKRDPAEWSGQTNARLDRPVRPLLGQISALAAADSNYSFSVVEIPRPAPQPAPIIPEADFTESTISIHGDLEKRTLLSQPTLRPQFADAALSNTVVQVDVDAEGNVFTPPVVLPGGSSGSVDTDNYAQQVARSLRFNPLPRQGRPGATGRGGLTEGTVLFHWHTEAAPATNLPPGAP